MTDDYALLRLFVADDAVARTAEMQHQISRLLHERDKQADRIAALEAGAGGVVVAYQYYGTLTLAADADEFMRGEGTPLYAAAPKASDHECEGRGYVGGEFMPSTCPQCHEAAKAVVGYVSKNDCMFTTKWKATTPILYSEDATGRVALYTTPQADPAPPVAGEDFDSLLAMMTCGDLAAPEQMALAQMICDREDERAHMVAAKDAEIEDYRSAATAEAHEVDKRGAQIKELRQRAEAMAGLLRECVEKWRALATSVTRHAGTEALAISGTYAECANTLDALLKLAGQKAVDPTHDDMPHILTSKHGDVIG